MTAVGYKLDNHTPRWWVTALRRADPAIRTERVGSPGSPPQATPDLALLRYCETNKLVLVTSDRRSIYGHIADHTNAGGTFYGMIQVPGPITTEELVSDLQLVHAIFSAEDMAGLVMTLPL